MARKVCKPSIFTYHSITFHHLKLQYFDHIAHILGSFSSQPFELGTRHPFGDIFQDRNPLDLEVAWELSLGG